MYGFSGTCFSISERSSPTNSTVKAQAAPECEHRMRGERSRGLLLLFNVSAVSRRHAHGGGGGTAAVLQLRSFL